MILFLKAAAGQAMLFPGVVPVKGHMRAGAFVKPHQAKHELRADDPRQDRLEDYRPPCRFCGEPEHLALHEMWADHNFMLEACCADHHDEVVAEMADDPAYAAEVLRELGAEEFGGRPLRRVAFTDDGFGPVLLDWQPQVGDISRGEANAFIARWHRHNPPLPADQWRFGIWNGNTLLGIVMGGAPTARAYMDAFKAKELCEVRRVAIRTDLPRELTWKAASELYKAAAAEAERRGFRKIITYTLADQESGMSLRYARWKPEQRIVGKTWNRPSRPRRDNAPIVDKLRWFKVLHPEPAP